MHSPNRHMFLVLALASTSCAQVLGLDDDARLSATTSAGDGGAMGSTSTSGVVSSSSETAPSTTGGGDPPKNGNGATCDSAGDCASGHCVGGPDGARICCDAECNSVCESCFASETNGHDGKCADARAGLNPRQNCMASGCDTGVCDGKGACGIVPQGTPCGTPSCVSGGLLGTSQCDDAGACVVSSKTCANHIACANGQCAASCSVESDCVAGFFCAPPHCQEQKGKNAPCAHAYECLSNQCTMNKCA